MLKLDFYESGHGETILITFPSGGIGVVDAHPSTKGSRAPILELVRDRRIHFVCLTHPHSDHGVDLTPILDSQEKIDSFWHTVSDVDAFIYGIEETRNFPGPNRQVALDLRRGWAEFLIDLFAAVVKRAEDSGMEVHQLRDDLRHRVIDNVEIHCLSPEERIKHKFIATYRKRFEGRDADIPDPNLLSAILVLKYGKSVVVLGGDALKANWHTVVKKFREYRLPKASVLKVPHHGALNAIILHPKHKESNYLEICSRLPKAVLFAGDSKHPHPKVYEKLREKTDLFCLSNGLKDAPGDSDPLRLGLLGARAISLPKVCNPFVGFELDAHGTVRVVSGTNCGHLRKFTPDR